MRNVWLHSRKDRATAFASVRTSSWWTGLLLASAGAALGAEIDTAELPPPANVQIVFERDIQPVLERACLRCHGPERPKSGFRLDQRDLALRGGDYGIAIVPGNSAASPLIHYVAHLVEEMEMPPPGKGVRLTSHEIGLLRAWIDQGVPWSDRPLLEREKLLFSITPAVRWIGVSGDERAFRQHQWDNDGWAGGVQKFRYEQRPDDSSLFTAEGEALFDDHDYKLRLGWERPDVGFVRFGFEQIRAYYDDSGGFFEPFATDLFSLDQNLHLDIGRAWIDVGLTLPDLPRLRLGYEHQYRDGAKSMLHWSDVFDANGNTAAIFPAAKQIDETGHIVKFDASHEINGLWIEDNFRAEFYDLESSSVTRSPFPLGEPPPDSAIRVDDRSDHFQAVNTFRLEKQLRDWLFLSGGYLFSKLDGNAAFDLAGFVPSDPTTVLFQGDRSDQIILERRAHVWNANAALGPWDGLTLSTGLQTDWTREEGFGEAFLPGFPAAFPKIYSSDRDKLSFQENLGIRYTKLPFSVLFGEVRLRQETVDHFERQTVFDSFDDEQDFLRDTDANSHLEEFRAGFTTSPWRRVSLQGTYKRRMKDDDYDHQRDFDLSELPGNGYPAFIRSRQTDTDELEAKLTVHWRRWLKTTASYQLVATDYHTVTDPGTVVVFDPVTFLPMNLRHPGGGIFAGNYDAHVYSLNTTLNPWRRLLISATVSYNQSRTVSGVNNSPSIVPYKGSGFSTISSATFVLSKQTDWHASYGYTSADFEQDHPGTAELPLGIRYSRHGLATGFTHRFNSNISGRLEYGFFDYDEPSFGNANHYTAHALFLGLSIFLP